MKVMESDATARRKKSLESEVNINLRKEPSTPEEVPFVRGQYFKVLACLLGHENVVKVFAVYGVEQRHAIIIMEYVGSRNLHHLLVEKREKHLSRDWLLGVAAQVGNSLVGAGVYILPKK